MLSRLLTPPEDQLL